MRVTSKLPLNIYFSIGIPTLFVIIGWNKSENHFVLLIYSIVLFLILYYHLSRYSCIVKLDDDKIYISYLSPWLTNESINVKDILDIDYQRGFYNLFSDKTIGGLFVFPKYCNDRMIFYMKNGTEKIINVNTRIFYFKKIIKLIKTKLK